MCRKRGTGRQEGVDLTLRAARGSGGEISYDALVVLFRETYGYYEGSETRFAVKSFKLEHLDASGRAKLSGSFIINGKDVVLEGEGNGPLSAAVEAVNRGLDGRVSIREYAEHSIGEGSEVKAASYVEVAYEGPGGSPKLTK